MPPLSTFSDRAARSRAARFVNSIAKRCTRPKASSLGWRLACAHGATAAVLVASSLLAACQGCRTTGAAGTGGNGAAASGAVSTSADPSSPTLRLYLVSDLAGALEPCGCMKDQLGGLDHAAAWIRSEKPKAPSSALLAAGPLFFMDAKLKDDHRDQDVAKAETIAASLKTLGFAAFAPGVNEWAGGDAELGKLEAASGGALLFANGTSTAVAAGEAGASPALGQWVVREIGGVKVGIVGVSLPGQGPSLAPPPPVQVTPAPEAITRGIEALRAQGAKVFVALAATGRGEAKRLADAVPTLTAILVGSTGGSGELNSPAPPPERIGSVLILETGNHLTTVGTLDLFVRDGSFSFADATGLELGQKREELRRRIDDLRARIALWDKDSAVKKEDVDARRAELAKLEADLAALGAHPPPTTGSFFRYGVQEVRDSLGTDADVKAAAAAYYKQINDHNRVAFADRPVVPHTGDQPVYLGVNVCTTCHKEARAFWDGTSHAHAYATLSDQNKQFNLDCVSCHVTGYEQPGGSNVTHVARFENVQCEVCHGPGSKHALDPRHVKPPTPKPKGDLCLTCHHAPHVEGFDPEKKMTDILGPGHGL